MTLAKLASLIAKREGKRSQARIGDIREVLKIICAIEMDAIRSDILTMSGPSFLIRQRAFDLIAKEAKRKARARK